jgi:hypothetical protein
VTLEVGFYVSRFKIHRPKIPVRTSVRIVHSRSNAFPGPSTVTSIVGSPTFFSGQSAFDRKIEISTITLHTSLPVVSHRHPPANINYWLRCRRADYLCKLPVRPSEKFDLNHRVIFLVQILSSDTWRKKDKPSLAMSTRRHFPGAGLSVDISSFTLASTFAEYLNHSLNHPPDIRKRAN